MALGKGCNTLAKTQAEREKRHLELTLARLAQEIMSKAKSLNRLCDEVRLQYESLAGFTGGVGGGRHKLFTDRIEENRNEISQIIRAVEEASLSGTTVEEMTAEQIEAMLLTYTMKREELMELASVPCRREIRTPVST